MYQRKYCLSFRQLRRYGIWNLTWLVQTLLKDTNANVWANMVDGRSFLASISGSAKAARKSCGRNAIDSS